MVMDFMPHSSFVECWSARSPLDNQGILRQLLATARLAEFPLYIPFSLWSHQLDPLLQFPQWTDEITTNWYTMWLPLSSCNFWFMRPNCDTTDYNLKSDGKWLQKFTDWYLGQVSFASRDILIEKIGANTEFKLSFTSPSIEELASS